MSEYKPPLRARLHWYRLSAAEFALLTAMCEHRSDGSTVWASIARLAAYSKLSERTVQVLIRRFCGRGILSQLAPANAAKRMPATYQVNESALEEDPRMVPYRGTGQEQLLGIPLSTVPGEPIPDPDLVQSLHQSDAATAPNSRLDSRSSTLPNPPFQGGNLVSDSTSKEYARESSETSTDFHRRLTRRDRNRLNEQIYLSMRDPRVDFNSAMETACARLMIPLSDAWATARASGIDPMNRSTRRNEADS